MAVYAREPIFVLDVAEDDTTRVQMFGYKNVTTATGEQVESGCTTALSTAQAWELLQALVEAGVLPILLLLRWRLSGNHFQAVVFDQDRHDKYTADYDELSKTRNVILTAHGHVGLDTDAYDETALEKAANESIADCCHNDAGQSRADKLVPLADSEDFEDPRRRVPKSKTLSAKEHTQMYHAMLSSQVRTITDARITKHQRELMRRNQAAFAKWSEMRKRIVPQLLNKVNVSDPVDGVVRWLYRHLMEMRSLMRAMPYPELIFRFTPIKI